MLFYEILIIPFLGKKYLTLLLANNMIRLAIVFVIQSSFEMSTKAFTAIGLGACHIENNNRS